MNCLTILFSKAKLGFKLYNGVSGPLFAEIALFEKKGLSLKTKKGVILHFFPYSEDELKAFEKNGTKQIKLTRNQILNGLI